MENPILPSTRKAPVPANVQRGFFVLGGIVIGAGIVLATLAFMRPEPPRVIYRSQPAGEPQAMIQTPVPNGNTPDPAKKVDSAKPGATPTEQGAVQPYNPFAGNIGGSFEAAPEPGRVSSRIPSRFSFNTEAAPRQVPEEPQSAVRGLLVTVRLDVSDPDGAVRELQGLAGKAGGLAIEFDETAVKESAEGAILFVPATRADEVEKALGSVGGVVATDHWNGSSSNRIDRVESNAQDRISDLHLKRQELLVKYTEDAPQIKHIDEDTDRINKSLGSFRSNRPGMGTAVFKIRFL